MQNRRFYVYTGLGLVSASTLILQIALTRIFSVILWYHMSLVTVSLAMFGLTIGALLVGRANRYFTPDRLIKTCSFLSVCMGVSIVVCLVLCLNIPFNLELSLLGVVRILLWITIIAIPFLLSGIIVCAILTSSSVFVGRLYAADLAGAALACLLSVWLLNELGAINAILVAGCLGTMAAYVFARAANQAKQDLVLPGFATLLILFLIVINVGSPMIRIQYVLGRPQASNRWQREYWNVFSYVTETFSAPMRLYWGAGTNADKAERESKQLVMDTRASTYMVRFNGNWDTVKWLQDDVTNLVHHLRSDGRMLVIGVGAGRDVLSALIDSRGKRLVDGVDVNPAMIGLLKGADSEFTGGIGNMPNVNLVVDEARSWVERTKNRYQAITIPLVDTSAASSAGAYALTENSLYTKEAFALFLHHLTPDGILSVSRWWHGGKLGETHRLISLATNVLYDEGVRDLAAHIVLLRGDGLVTLLMSPTPFSTADIGKLDETAKKSGFEILLAPQHKADAELSSALLDIEWYRKHAMANVLDLSPPTDDRPFFFHFFRLSHIFDSDMFFKTGAPSFDVLAMIMLGELLIVVSFLALLILCIPLVSHWRKHGGSAARVLAISFIYFSAIGLGFMFFESAQIQRLNVFLGYPVYALTVALFSLLISSALGSFLASQWIDKYGTKPLRHISMATLVVLFISGLMTPIITHSFAGSETPVRIAVAALIIAPSGILLGMFFPMGMQLIRPHVHVSRVWCWAVNGMMSTCAAVYSIALSISFGFSFTFYVGALCYFFASLAAVVLQKQKA